MLGFHAISEEAISALPAAGASPEAVIAVGDVVLQFDVQAAATHTAPANPAAVGLVELEFDVQAAAAHGVGSDAVVNLEFAVDAHAAHGVSGSANVDLGFEVLAAAAHGVQGSASVTLEMGVDAAAIHPRYEVRGEVRNAGVLVERRVRVYLRSSGALAGEADTAAGRFQVHTGFAPAEHYIVPVDLSAEAEDWVPPVANRVVSVLAEDA